MGRALAAGLTAGHPGLAERLHVADAVPGVAEAAVAELGGAAVSVAQAAECRVVLLAVKPKDMAGLLQQVAPVFRPGAVLVSVVAGWDLPRLRAGAPGAGLVRTMPNLAVRHGAGLVAVSVDGLDGDTVRAILGLLEPLGEVVRLPESLFPAATALAGSGPGLVALVAEAMEEGGVRAGLSRDQARAMTRAVLAGTAALLGDGGDPAALRQRVSSPAGTTVAGLAVLERGAVRAHMADAVVAAAHRAGEL